MVPTFDSEMYSIPAIWRLFISAPNFKEIISCSCIDKPAMQTLKRCCSGRDCDCQGEAICDDDDQALERMYDEMAESTTAEELFNWLDDTGIPYQMEWH